MILCIIEKPRALNIDTLDKTRQNSEFSAYCRLVSLRASIRVYEGYL